MFCPLQAQVVHNLIMELGAGELPRIEVFNKCDLLPVGEIMPHGEDICAISARTGEEDKVEALDLGANDYVTKPFGTAELLARVRVALRDIRRLTGGAPSATFRLQDLQIHYDRRSVRLGDETISLTQTEYNILALLSEHAGKGLTYSTIIKAIWGYPDEGSIKKLQVNMANIRRKLGCQPGDNRYIINELGVGYRMQEENEV